MHFLLQTIDEQDEQGILIPYDSYGLFLQSVVP